VSEAIIAARAK